MRGHALSPRGELVRDRTFRTEQRDAGGFAPVNLSIFSSSKQAGTASPEPTFIQKREAAPWVGPLHFSAPERLCHTAAPAVYGHTPAVTLARLAPGRCV